MRHTAKQPIRPDPAVQASAWSAWSAAAAVVAVVVSLWSVRLGVVVALVTLGAGASYVDVISRRIPDALSVGTLAVAIGAGAAAQRLAIVVAMSVFVGGAMLVVHLIDPDGLGFGDVKYTAALGGLLGVVMPPSSVVAVIVGASVIAAVAAAAVRSWRNGVPFGLVVSIVACVGVGLL